MMRYLICLMLSAILLAAPLVAEELQDYSVSWIGNSFSGGNAGWVPQDVQDIFVAPDGTVFTTVGWEEHRGNIAAFRDGKLLQQSAHWKSGGIDRLVGESICATDRYIFYPTGTPNGHDGKVQGTWLARRDRADIASRQHERRIEVGVVMRGVCATNERVFAAGSDGQVRVFDQDLTPMYQWPAPSPGEMAVDATGHLWIIDTASRAILKFDQSGRQLPPRIEMPDGVVPADIAVTPNGQMLVADAGPQRQVRIYGNPDAVPQLQSTFGEPGGVFAGPVVGEFGERRFIAPIGVGADAQGNLYVASGPYAETHGGTTVIEGYAPGGNLNWRVMSTEWLDTVDADRSADATVLYGSKYRYTLDLDRPTGQQWQVAALTLHPDRFPDDPRLKSAARGGVWHRIIEGHPYLFLPDMNGGDLFVFRFDPEQEGEIAIPCATISTKQLWVDTNGNGRREDEETATQSTGETRGWFVEPDGTVWQATRNDGIFEYPLADSFPHDVTVYPLSSRRHHPMPAPLTELRRVTYDRANDTMYLGGSTQNDKAQHWKPMGPNLATFASWSTAPALSWHVVFPHETSAGGHESYEPFDFAVEGDYIFVVYAGRLPSQDLPTGTVIILARQDGRVLGHMQPSGTRTGAVPMDALQDMVHSINTFRRADGEYLIFIEDDGYTKNLMYRWRP